MTQLKYNTAAGRVAPVLASQVTVAKPYLL
jgi:hypothetical protein